MGQLPLRTAEDCVKWFEKTINEMKESNVSIALGNGRASVIKGIIGLKKLQMDYAKMVKQGAKVIGMTEFLQIEQKS